MIPLDTEGYVIDQSLWTPGIAEHLAAEEGIALGPQHWELITLVQAYYGRFDHAPHMRPLVNWIKQCLGPEQGTSLYLHTLFPVSPAKQLARIAGLPKPAKCL